MQAHTRPDQNSFLYLFYSLLALLRVPLNTGKLVRGYFDFKTLLTGGFSILICFPLWLPLISDYFPDISEISSDLVYSILLLSWNSICLCHYVQDNKITLTGLEQQEYIWSTQPISFWFQVTGLDICR